MRAEQLVSCRAEIGEGPLYDETTDSLFWVDISNGRLWRRQIGSGNASHREIGEPLGSIALMEGSGLLLAAKRGLLALDRWEETPVLLAPVEPDLPTQCNDGKCDSRGRFVFGTAAPDRSCKGALYRADRDGSVHTLILDLGMSNGLDWSPDDRCFYHVDSLAQTVYRYDWNADDGVPSRPVPFVVIPAEDGLPDGLAVDCEGNLWLAIWGAGEVRRYTPDGRQSGAVSIPTPNVTSCAFGGAGLDILFVTTAALAAPTAGEAGAAAGNVFAVETAVRGQPRPRFVGGRRSGWTDA